MSIENDMYYHRKNFQNLIEQERKKDEYFIKESERRKTTTMEFCICTALISLVSLTSWVCGITKGEIKKFCDGKIFSDKDREILGNINEIPLMFYAYERLVADEYDVQALIYAEYWVKKYRPFYKNNLKAALEESLIKLSKKYVTQNNKKREP